MGEGKIFVTHYKNLICGVENSKLISIAILFYILYILKYYNATSSIFKYSSYKNFASSPLQIPLTKQSLIGIV